MGFGASVSALLETYDNCLSLLKAFKRQKRQDGSRKVSKASDQQALLKHSLKTDRKKVERAYSSRVAEAGSRFEKGDSKSKSALIKVLKRLNAAVTSIIRLASQGSNPAVDYQSLMSLSNSSRLQAVKAFEQLSHRLDSKSSRGSVVTTSTSRSSKSSRSSNSSEASKSSRSRTSSTGSSSSSKKSKHKRAKATKRTDPASNCLVKADPRRQVQLPPRLEPSIQTPLLDAMDRRNGDPSLTRRRSSTMNRFSLVSISSGSTRLGEIPERKWRRGHEEWDADGGSEEYTAPIVYPLKPYQPVVKERRFWGLFRRGN